MSVYQSISETGFIIGHFDPHNVEAEVRDGMISDYWSITKATTGEQAASAIFDQLKTEREDAKARRAARATQAAADRQRKIDLEAESNKVRPPNTGSPKLDDWHKRRQEGIIRDRLDREMTKVSPKQRAAQLLDSAAAHAPTTRTGKVALGLAAAGGVAAINQKRIKTKAGETRDVRRYRPASLHYDDGLGKSAEEIVKDWVASVPPHKQLPIVPKASAPSAGATPKRITATVNPNSLRDAAKSKLDAEAAEKAAKRAESATKARITREANARVKAAADQAQAKGPPKLTAKEFRQKATQGARSIADETARAATHPENMKLLAGLGAMGATGAAGGVGRLLRRGRKSPEDIANSRRAVEEARAAGAAQRKAAQQIRHMKIGGGAAAGVAGTALLANALANKHRRPVYELEGASKSMDTIEKGPISGAKKIFASATPKSRRLKAHVKSRGASGLAEDAATGTEKLAATVADISGHATRTSRNVKSVIQDINDVKGGNYNTAAAQAAKKPRFSTTQKVVGGGALAGGLLIGHNLAGPKPYPYQQQG
jgi:hypothetical protein